MTDVTPNEARMPEDAAVTVTNADTLRAMASRPWEASASSLARLRGPSAITWGSLHGWDWWRR